ncbi:hypothetical protein BIZ82_gp022 [Erwinia phage vB_EamM_EarlPhillipIV]|uniref:Uncharacterized protein n=1 Tax=Erwinia phage vB_EamM_EarlPhillipIV TaxID=1883372 RepID=A0A1B2ICB2_9CAUD|nr:hypothetical protein BIZ82_gp022 [Erwinia phage vB_EamM_EarlPhillipIV]ANZ48872.1 hypothetical protein EARLPHILLIPIV_22 [Erwinia phage vB_EamM_EarlPhillipIV]
MEKYYFCKDVDAAAPELASVAYPTPEAAILNYLLYLHPTVKHMCKLTRPAYDDKAPYQLTTSRPKELVSLFVCETDIRISDGGGRTIYGDDNTAIKTITDCPLRDLCEAYRIPLIIERH